MTPACFEHLPLYSELQEAARHIAQPHMHLRHLLEDPTRFDTFSLAACGLHYDFSRQRLTGKALSLLRTLAGARGVHNRFREMISGTPVNVTEKRAALHTAARSFSTAPLIVGGEDIMPRIRRVRAEMQSFSRKILNGDITGSTGKRFRHVVVIGIGGSYLGTAFISEALAALSDTGIRLHYLSNVDIHNLGDIAGKIDPETTLWVVISKSYTTTETMANAHQARTLMLEKGLSPARHFVTVTAKGSPGDVDGPGGGTDSLAAFHMFDFIGGRYSVTSAVGGVPLSLFLGWERFERILKGAEEMDRHAAAAPPEENLPLTAALISFWNNNLLGYPAQALIPYAAPLRKLAPHVQQLSMESNGKSVTAEGQHISFSTGYILFGEPGTNAQHSFFQLLHQGRPVPVEFIGVRTPLYSHFPATTKGVSNHQELWANLISQPMALALGRENDDPARSFPGNRPSSTLVLESLTPENVGRLLSFYEAKTVYEAFLWGTNPFDQFGVELGKVLATDVRKEMAAKNRDPRHAPETLDPISRRYVEMLFRKDERGAP